MADWNKLVAHLGTGTADTDFQSLFFMLSQNCIDKVNVSGRVRIGFGAMRGDY